MKKLTAVLLLTAMTAGLAACGSNKGADTNTDAPAQNESTEETVTTEASDAAQNADIQGTITLAAAASLEKSFTEHLIPMFEEQYPEVFIEGTYDSSGKLQSQIEAGADVDIFFSAALKQIKQEKSCYGRRQYERQCQQSIQPCFCFWGTDGHNAPCCPKPQKKCDDDRYDRCF